MQASAVRNNLARACQRNPGASPVQVIRTLEIMYRSALTGIGAAVGAAVAAPPAQADEGILEVGRHLCRDRRKRQAAMRPGIGARNSAATASASAGYVPFASERILVTLEHLLPPPEQHATTTEGGTRESVALSLVGLPRS